MLFLLAYKGNDPVTKYETSYLELWRFNMSIFDSKFKHVVCNTWDTTQSSFEFPEQAITEIADRKNVGLAFSGGGTRSASATLGQLRGLHETNLLNKAKYISCVSGGSWTCIPFTFLPNSMMDKTFLGKVIPPNDVTLEYLQKTDRNSFAHAISNSILFDDFISQAARFAGDETFSRAVGDTFLTPFDIDSLKRFFSLNDKSIADIVTRNPNMDKDNFYQVHAGRPFLIVGSIIIRKNNDSPLPKRIPFETTPLYAGINVRHKKAGSNGRDIGGGYVEPFGFDSDEPETVAAGKPVKVRLGASRHRYTLSDVMGAAGAAPAEILAKFGLDWVGLPEFKYWPPSAPTTRAKEYTFGDGGILENLGVMPLLLRKVEKIIVFVNTQHCLSTGKINDSIPALFGKTPDFNANHVFPKNQYKDLVNGLMAAKNSDKTVMHQDKYTVVSNPLFGIAGGWDVEVLWVYNEMVPDWGNQLPSNIKNLIGSGSLGNFPHYRTFFQNPPAIIDLSAKQTAMLAHLSCWNILENQTVFEKMLT